MESPTVAGKVLVLETFEARFTVAVGAVVLDGQDRVLLVKHVEAKRGGFWFGKWICPRGKLTIGETLVDGSRREVKEETDLDVEPLGNVIVFDRIVTDGSKTKLHVVYIDFVAKVTGGELNPGSDAGAANWFSKEELKERWAELHEDTQKLLRESEIIENDVPRVR